MLPMSNGRCSLVWCHPQSKSEEIQSWSDERFCTELQKAFGWRLGRITHAGKRSVYPLALTTATRAVSHRLALVGNAAQTLHPIAGQGFNLGLRDVASLAEVIADDCRARGAGADPGDAAVLAAYASWRHNDRRTVIGFTDGLVRLFGNRLPPVRAARAVGLLAFDLFPPAKAALARLSMGLAGRVPRLARGLPL